MDLVCPCSTEFRVTVSTESITPPNPANVFTFMRWWRQKCFRTINVCFVGFTTHSCFPCFYA